MQVSLNELQMESRKAARGAGLAWGVAEEAGFAISWLAERGIDALPALLQVLDVAQLPDQVGGPLQTGIAIADRARALADGEVLAFSQIRRPILVVPFLVTAARLARRTMILQHEDGAWVVSPLDLDPRLLAAAVKMEAIVAVTIKAAEEMPMRLADAPAAAARLQIDPALWGQLQHLAHRTYVPATSESRDRGAGAGRIDND